MGPRYPVPEHRGHMIGGKLAAVFPGKLCQIRGRVFQRGSRRSVPFAVGPMARCTVGMKHFIARIWRGRWYRFLLDFFGLGLRFARND